MIITITLTHWSH